MCVCVCACVCACVCVCVCRFYVVLRGSLSLLVDPNVQRALQTNTTSPSDVASKEARRLSRGTTFKGTSVKKEGGSSSKHMYGKEISRLTSGDYFGEEALLQKESRAPHTVRTKERVELMSIDIFTFNQALLSYFEDVLLKRAEFLAGLEWFRNWTPHTLRQLAFMLRERHHAFQECLYRQGMIIPGILFIQSGSVRISTHCDVNPPEELLDKIHPVKDYLPEILAEDQPKKTPSKVSVFSSLTSSRSSFSEGTGGGGLRAPTPPNVQQNSTTSLLSLSKASQLTVQQKKKKKNRRKSTLTSQSSRNRRKERVEAMGFVTHHPDPAKNVDLCLLGPGDMLCDNEAICKLKKHLFNVVCESDVILYELNRFYFELMFENKMPRVLHQMACRAKQRAGIWGATFDSIHFLRPLGVVLEQMVEQLEAAGSHKVGRKKPLYTPNMLAFTAIKGLGKTLCDDTPTPREGKRESFQFPEVTIRIELASSSSDGLKGSPLRFPLSPFEPKIPDFERMCCLMPYSHPRFKDNTGDKSFFDSPRPVRKCGGHTLVANSSSNMDSIPVPLPYPSLSTSSKLPTLNVEYLTMPVVDKSEAVSSQLSKGNFPASFSNTNNPDTLAKIRIGIMFGKSSMVSNPSTCSTKASDMKNAKHRLHNHQLHSRPQSKMASETKPVLAMPLPSAAAIQLMSRDQLMKQLSGQREVGVEGGSEGTETGSSAMDNELTHIPKEYTRLVGMGAEHSKQLQGTMATKARRGQGECSVCTQLYRKADCKEYHSLPFMKTMMKVIENRTSSLLTT